MIRLPTRSRSAAARPASGSSSSSTRGLVASASAHVEQPLAAIGRASRPRRVSMPRRPMVAMTCASVSRLTLRATRGGAPEAETRGMRAPARRGGHSRRPQSVGNRLVIWKERPMPARGDRFRRQAGDRRPRRRTSPWSGRNMPEIRLKAVVLPAPLGPISACSARSLHGDVDALDRLDAAEALGDAGARRGSAPVDRGRAASGTPAAAPRRPAARRHRRVLDDLLAEGPRAAARRRRRDRSARTR